MHRNKWKWKNNNPKPMRFSKSSAKKEVHSNTSLSQKTRETSNKQPNFTPKQLLKKEKSEAKNLVECFVALKNLALITNS